MGYLYLLDADTDPESDLDLDPDPDYPDWDLDPLNSHLIRTRIKIPLFGIFAHSCCLAF